MSELPLITALVTTHNRPQLLQRALDSVAVQSYPNLELVVVDDGSQTDVYPIVATYEEVLPVRFIRHEYAKGACRARNRGIEAAAGEFIAGLDDDDAWVNKRIERLLQAYDDRFSFVTSDVRMFYKKGNPVWKKPRKITFNNLLYNNYVGNQGLIRTKRLLDVGGFDESLVAAQDYDLWIRLSEKYGPIRNVTEPLQNIYMEHGGDRITNPRDQLRGYLQFYQKHKAKMNHAQRKYQLYNIRKAMGRAGGLFDLLRWVPPHRYWKEIKGRVADKLFTE